MSRPHEERTFAENNDNLAGAQEFSQSEPVAEEPIVVGSKKEMNEETVLDQEAVEEAESSSNGDDVAKEKRLEMQRTASNWTQATGTSYASSVQQEAEQAPRKQTWSEKLNPLKSRNPPPVPSERIPSREHNASFLSVLYFQWINPLMVAGYQRPLELNDIWQVNPDRSVYVLSERLNAAYRKRKEQGGKNRMAMALYDTFKFEFILGGSCQLTSAILQVARIGRYACHWPRLGTRFRYHRHANRAIDVYKPLHLPRYDGRWPGTRCAYFGHLRQSHDNFRKSESRWRRSGEATRKP
jgi:ATP-binding cassette subfamily C (CFTR/MRP) protein 1